MFSMLSHAKNGGREAPEGHLRMVGTKRPKAILSMTKKWVRIQQWLKHLTLCVNISFTKASTVLLFHSHPKLLKNV